MKNIHNGFAFVLMGLFFLIITFMQSSTTLLWGILVGVSIFSNFIGIVKLINFIKIEMVEE